MDNKVADKKVNRVLNATLITAAIIFVGCVAGDIFGLAICRYAWSDNLFGGRFLMDIVSEDHGFTYFVAIYYLCTFLTYGILFSVTRLLLNLKKGIVFDKENTRMMKYISAGCFTIFAICTLGMLVTLPLALVAIVGLFVGLIVQCVRVVMDKAIDMRSELDLTI